ncbi:DNA-binding transcriptional regulator, MarR family [Sharpea azabuensis]|uniref:MarR family winged helix-turn-helix transcriptional regulator n=1 Tax=Sharpea azabuensis TaxID=322505 RepID=UPI0008EAF0E4|nr:MarR family winged helix-turn-helix transcriptional regulator [Sharpea azabuensis]SFE12889.1 DNA-binding transcriptional regulator, MarR family [Sharpea azabuensis]SFL02217.1 DNA-binding transcriptional regulator, MarR family [Sharpea azabuensis]
MNSRKFFYDFGKALYHVDSFYDEFAKQSNVSSSLLWVLYALNDGNSHTQIEISNDWELPKTTVNTVIKDIQKEGYVDLVPIKGKRREMSIVLTESGKAFADNVLSDLYRKEEEVFKLLSPKEQEIVMVLEKLARKLKEED